MEILGVISKFYSIIKKYTQIKKQKIMNEDFHYFASSCLSLLTTYSFYKLIRNQWNICQNNQRISDISRSSIKTPEDSFSDKQKCIIKGIVQKNPANKNEKPITFQDQKKKKNEFILHLRYIESIYSNEGFEKDRKNYRINLKQIGMNCDISFQNNFLLKEGKSQVFISNFDQIDYSPALQITKWQQMRRRLSFGEKIQILMLTYWRSIGVLALADNRATVLKGIDIGTRQVQAGITVGSSLMALGTISLSADGKVNFEPHLFFKDRLSYLTNLKEVVSSLQKKRNVWGIIFVLGSIYLARRVFKYHKKNNLIRMIKEFLGMR